MECRGNLFPLSSPVVSSLLCLFCLDFFLTLPHLKNRLMPVSCRPVQELLQVATHPLTFFSCSQRVLRKVGIGLSSLIRGYIVF